MLLFLTAELYCLLLLVPVCLSNREEVKFEEDSRYSRLAFFWKNQGSTKPTRTVLQTFKQKLGRTSSFSCVAFILFSSLLAL